MTRIHFPPADGDERESDDEKLENIAGYPGAIHTSSPEMEEEANRSQVGVGGDHRGSVSTG